MSQSESTDPKVRSTWEQIPFSSSVTLDKFTALSLSCPPLYNEDKQYLLGSVFMRCPV